MTNTTIQERLTDCKERYNLTGSGVKVELDPGLLSSNLYSSNIAKFLFKYKKRDVSKFLHNLNLLISILPKLVIMEYGIFKNLCCVFDQRANIILIDVVPANPLPRMIPCELIIDFWVY